MNTKLLLALLALGANAKFVANVGGSLGISYRKLKVVSKDLVTANATAVTGSVNPAIGTDDVKITGTEVTLDDPSKKVYPGDVAASVTGMWKTDAPFSFGLGCKIGYRHFFNRPEGDSYGKTNVGAIHSVSFKHPTGAFFARPCVMAAFDISDITLCLSLGIDASYQEWGMNYADAASTDHKTSKSSNWIYGVCVGLEGIYKVGPCFGVGVGVTFTYYPESFAKFDQKGTAQKINPTASNTAELLNLGKTWSLMGHVSAHYAVNA